MSQVNSSPKYDEKKHSERIRTLSQKILQQKSESSEYGLAKTIFHQNHTPKTLPFLIEVYLNSMVDSPPFHVETSFSIQQPDYFILLLYLIPYLRVSEQIENLDKFIVILEDSMRNCYVLTKSGVIGVITDLIRRRDLFEFCTHTTNQFFRLIGILGGFSITVKELKGLLHFVLKEDKKYPLSPNSYKENFELDPELAPMILEILLKMSRNAYPSSFFNFNGRTTGLVLDAPSLDFPKNGYTFSCWMRIENAKSTVPIRIFSIFDEAENGLDCYFFQNKIAIQIPKARKNVVFSSMNFVTGRWYLINIVHFKQRKRIIFKKCVVRLYVNGEYKEEKEFPYPNFTTTIQFADIGSNRPVDIDPPSSSSDKKNQQQQQRKKRRSTRKITSQYLFSGFCGQMSAICFMSIPLRREHITALFRKGPDFQYNFGEKSETEFQKSVFLLYNPRTARSRCENNAPLSRNVEARVLKGTHTLVTHTIRDTLTCVGGFEVLYCFFEGLMTYGELWTIETGLCARLITLIAQLMYGTDAKEEMMMRGGIQTLALLLGRLPIKQVNINAFKALQGLVQPMEVGSVLWKDVFRHIFMNFPLWIRTEFSLQKELLEFLYENMKKKPRVLEEIRKLTDGVGFWLDALRLYFYYPEEIERWSQPEFERGVKHEEVKDLRKMFLLPIIRLYLLPPIEIKGLNTSSCSSTSSSSSTSTPGSPMSDSETSNQRRNNKNNKNKNKKRTSQSVSADRFRKKMSRKKSKKKNKKKDSGEKKKKKKKKKFMTISASSSSLTSQLQYSSSMRISKSLFSSNTMSKKKKKETMMMIRLRRMLEDDLLSIVGFLASSRTRIMQQMEILELMFDILDVVYSNNSDMFFNLEVIHLIAEDEFMKLLVELVKSFESEDLVLLYVKFMSKIADCVRLLSNNIHGNEYLNQMKRISNYFKIMLSGCRLTTKVYNTILDVLFGCFETLEIRRSPQELWEFSRSKNVKGLEISFIGILDTLFQFLVRGSGEVRKPTRSTMSNSPKKKTKRNKRRRKKNNGDNDNNDDDDDDDDDDIVGEEMEELEGENFYKKNQNVLLNDDNNIDDDDDDDDDYNERRYEEFEEEEDVATVDEDGSVNITSGSAVTSSKRRKKMSPMEIRRKAVKDLNKIVKSNRVNRNQILEFTKNWDYKFLSLVLPFGSPFNSKTVYGEIVPQVIESIVLLVNEEMMIFFDEEAREELQSKPSRSNFSKRSSSSSSKQHSSSSSSKGMTSPTPGSLLMSSTSHTLRSEKLTRFWRSVMFSCLEGMKLVCEKVEEFDFKRFQVEFYEMMFPFFFVKVEKIVNSVIESVTSSKRKSSFYPMQRKKSKNFNPKNIFLGTHTGYAFWKLFYYFVNYFYDSLVLEEYPNDPILDKRKVHLLEYVTTKFCNCFVKKIVDIPSNQTAIRNLLLNNFEKVMFYTKFKKVSFLSTVSKLIGTKQVLSHIPKNSVFLTFFHMFLYLFEHLGRKEDYERKQFIECFFFLMYFDTYHTRFMTPRDRKIYLQITKSGSGRLFGGPTSSTPSPKSPGGGSPSSSLDVPAAAQSKQQKRKSLMFGKRSTTHADRVKKLRRRSGGSGSGSSGRLTLLLKQLDPESLKVIDIQDNSESFNMRGCYLIGKMLFLLREYEQKKREFDVQETLLNIYELLPLLKSILRKYFKELKSTNEKFGDVLISMSADNIREDRPKGDFLLEYKLIWENTVLSMEPFETMKTQIKESHEQKRTHYLNKNRARRDLLRRQVRQNEEEAFEKFIMKMDFLKQQSKILKYRENNVIRFTGLSVNRRYKEKISNRMWNAKKKDFSTENGVFYRRMVDAEHNIFSLNEFILAKEEEIQKKKKKKKIKKKKSSQLDISTISPISSKKNSIFSSVDDDDDDDEEEECIRVILCETKKKRFIDVSLTSKVSTEGEESIINNNNKSIELKLTESVIKEEKRISVIMKPQSIAERDRIQLELHFGEEEEDDNVPILRIDPIPYEEEEHEGESVDEDDEEEEEEERRRNQLNIPQNKSDDDDDEEEEEEIDWDALETKLLDQKLYVRDDIENNSRMKFRFICVNNTERRNYFENRHLMKGARLRELIRQRSKRRRQDSSSFVSANLGSSIAEEDDEEEEEEDLEDDVVGSDEFSVEEEEEKEEIDDQQQQQQQQQRKEVKEQDEDNSPEKRPNLTIDTSSSKKNNRKGHQKIKSPTTSKRRNKKKRSESRKGRKEKKNNNNNKEKDEQQQQRRRRKSSAKSSNKVGVGGRKRRGSSKNRGGGGGGGGSSNDSEDSILRYDEEEEDDTMTSEVDDDEEEEESGIDEIDLNPFHTTNEKRLYLVERCERITPFQPVIGTLEITNKSIYFMPLPEMYQPSLADDSPCDDVMNSPSSTSPNFKKLFNLNTSTDSFDKFSSPGNRGRTLFLKEYQKSIFSIFWFPLSHIRYIQRHRYLYQYTALEFFLVTKRSVLFNFSQRHQPNLLKTLSSVILKNCFPKNSGLQSSLIRQAFLSVYKEKHPRYNLVRSKLTQLWIDGKLSNFDYLMQLNTFACRSYNDISQYPIFPWVLSDYDSEELDLSDPNVFRDLSKPVGVINQTKVRTLHDRYKNWMDQTVPAFHYGSHYSSSAVPVYFLIRNEPYTSYNLKFQGGFFDLPDRLFHSIKESWYITQNQYTDVKELIPEFYYFPDFLKNMHTLPLGKRQDGKRVHNVSLPKWAKGSPEEFIRIHREALESRYVSAHLHEWIDLIFGYKQRGINAVKAMNVFYYLTYEHLTKPINEITDPTARKSARIQIMNFGQTPPQMFLKPHPKKKLGRKSVKHHPSKTSVLNLTTTSEGTTSDGSFSGTNVTGNNNNASIINSDGKSFSLGKSNTVIQDNNVSGGSGLVSSNTGVVNTGVIGSSDEQQQQQQQQQGSVILVGKLPKKMKKRGHKIPLFEFIIDEEMNNSTTTPNSPSSSEGLMNSNQFGSLSSPSSPLNNPSSPIMLTPSPVLSNPPPSFPHPRKYRPRDRKNRCTVVSLTWVVKKEKSKSQASPGPGVLRTLPLSMVPSLHTSQVTSSQSTPLFVIDTRRKFRQFSYFRSRLEGEGKKPIGPSFSTDFLISTQTFCVTRNGRFVISCGHFDCSIKVSSIDKGVKGLDVKQSIQHHKEVVTCVKLGEEENFLISGSMDCTIKIWRLNKLVFRSGEKYRKGRRRRRKTQLMMPSKVDSLLRMTTNSEEDKSLVNDGLLMKHIIYHNTLFGHEFPISSVEINEDLDLVVSGDIRGSVKIFSLIEGKYIRTIQHPNHCRIQDLLISRRNANLIIYSKKDSILYQYSLNGNLIRSLIVPQLNHIVFSSYYNYLIGGGKKSIIVFPFFNIECFEEFYFVKTNTSHNNSDDSISNNNEDDEITCIASKDECTFVVGTKCGRIQYYSVNYQEILHRKKLK